MILLKKAQSSAEFAALVIVVFGALLAMSVYVKRGIQGRWKAAVDDLGEQYDPAYMNTRVMHVMTSNTQTSITTRSAGPRRVWTLREDVTEGTESRFGHIQIGTRVTQQAPSAAEDEGDETENGGEESSSGGED